MLLPLRVRLADLAASLACSMTPWRFGRIGRFGLGCLGFGTGSPMLLLSNEGTDPRKGLGDGGLGLGGLSGWTENLGPSFIWALRRWRCGLRSLAYSMFCTGDTP